MVAEGRRGVKVPHGTRSRYEKGCRCQSCREANTAYKTEWRAGNTRRGRPPKTHGTAYGYESFGCRCRPCTNAHNQSKAVHRALRQLEREGTVERVPGGKWQLVPTMIGRRVTWRRRLGVVTVTWYARHPAGRPKVRAMIHLPL